MPRLVLPATARGLRRGLLALTAGLLLAPAALAVGAQPADAHVVTIPSVPGGPVVLDGNDPGDHIPTITPYLRDVYANLDSHIAAGYVSNGKVAVVGTCTSYLPAQVPGETFEGFSTAAAVRDLFDNIGTNNYRVIHICSDQDPNAPAIPTLPPAVQTELAQWGGALVAHVNRGGGLFATGHGYAWLNDLFPDIVVTSGGTSASYVTAEGHALFPNLAVNSQLAAQNHYTFAGNDSTPLRTLLTESSGSLGRRVAIGGVVVRFPQLMLEGPTTAPMGIQQDYEFTAATADGTVLSSTAFTYTITDTAGSVVGSGSATTDAHGQYFFAQNSTTAGSTRLRVQMNLGGTAAGASTTTVWKPLAAQPVLTAANVAGQAGSTALSWSAPSSPYAAITDYVIERSDDGIAWTTVNDGVSATPGFTVTGLDPSVQHQFRITALTAAGPSLVSDARTVLPQTITLAALSDADVTSGPRTLTATASSGLSVSYASTTPAVCTVSGAALTYLTLGTCSITATQGGDPTYQPAAAASRTFVITAPAPAAAAQATTATGPVAQSTTVTPPAGGDVYLLQSGSPVTTLTVPGEGAYSVVPATGVITFTPETAFSGTATAVTYRVRDGYGQATTSTYTPTVVPTPLPALAKKSTAALGAQSATFPAPAGGSVTLLEGGNAVTSVAVPGQGAYSLNVVTGVVTFTPVAGYTGYPTPVSVRVTDVYGQTSSAAYSPLVLPVAPAPSVPSTTGTGTSTQSAAVTVPAGGTVTLLDATGTPATTVVVSGQGTYLLDAASGVVSFVPVAGFSGRSTPVPVRVADAYGQTGTTTYAVVVTAPAAPVSAPLTTSAGGAGTQTAAVPVPSGGSVTLLDASGTPVLSLTVPRQGTYVLDPATGVIRFTPVPGFHGTATPVTYRVTDAYQQSAGSTYSATVEGSVAAPTARVTTPATGSTKLAVVSATRGTLPATCAVSTGRVSRCTVTAYAVVSGRRVVVGTGTVVVPASRTTGTVSVPVRLNTVGQALAARPGGATVRVEARVTVRGVRSAVVSTTTGRVVASTMLLPRPVWFPYASSVLVPRERAYLTKLRGSLSGVRSVRCDGYTDARGSDVNVPLGQKRAEVTCAFLLRGTGVRSTSVGHGEHRPVATNETDPGRSRNRRTEIRFAY